jgi:hypothetical protein
MAWSPDRRFIAMARPENIYIFDTTTGSLKNVFAGDTDKIGDPNSIGWLP